MTLTFNRNSYQVSCLKHKLYISVEIQENLFFQEIDASNFV